MSQLVVDASVAIKWFVPEILGDEAVAVLEGQDELVAPDLILPEAGNILWKKVQRRELSGDMAAEILASLLATPVRLEPSAPFLPAAMELALATKTTVYDSLYLAVAAAFDSVLVTADRRLWERHRGGPASRHLRWLGAS